jgi:hypothetical protein
MKNAANVTLLHVGLVYTCRLYHQGEQSIVLCSPILITLMMEAIRSSETLVPTRATRRYNQLDDVLLSRRCESLKSYT